jgi:hypothetical protein
LLGNVEIDTDHKLKGAIESYSEVSGELTFIRGLVGSMQATTFIEAVLHAENFTIYAVYLTGSAEINIRKSGAFDIPEKFTGVFDIPVSAQGRFDVPKLIQGRANKEVKLGGKM